MQNSRIIYAPDKGTIDMIRRRVPAESRQLIDEKRFDAVALIQTSLPNIFYYADIGQKAGNVTALEVLGSCPQHISTLVFLGNTAAVNAAMTAVENASEAHEKIQ